jgi:hypothetical protein
MTGTDELTSLFLHWMGPVLSIHKTHSQSANLEIAGRKDKNLTFYGCERFVSW